MVFGNMEIRGLIITMGRNMGGYENYWDDKFEIIFCRGDYNMGERNNMWIWFDMCGKSLYKKEFYL